MIVEILELIKTNERDLKKWTERQDVLRNKIRFCYEHKFEEEIRVAESELRYFEGIICDYEKFLKDLKNISIKK